MNKNILYYYEQATKQELIDGLQWYARARHEACNMVKNTNIPVICAAGVISALSPFNPWERNLTDAQNVIDAYLSGKTPDSVSVSTFGKNKEKAFQILQNNSADIITKKSRKTFSFVHNIAYEDSPYVTIDRHALKVYRRKKSGGSENVGVKLYNQIENSYLETAKAIGITGYQLQAICWTVYKRMMNR